MADNIDAKIRISLIAEQAIKALRDLKRETLAVADAGKQLGADGASSTGGDSTPAAAAAGAAAKARRQEAAKEAAQARTQARADARDAAEQDRQSAAQQAAARRASRDAERAAAAEARATRRANAADAAALLRTQRANESKAAKEKRAEEVAADKATRQARNNSAQLSYQITDIVQGLATGQAPFTVAIQQGGQLTNVFGGMRGAASALLSVFTPLRVMVGSVAAVIGALALAAYQGRSEEDALNKSLALTGTAADTSAAGLNVVAQGVAAQSKASIGSVRDTLAALVQTGVYTESGMASAARAATAYAKLSGEAAADVAVRFADQADGVAAWAAKQNKALSYLSAEQYKYIRSLEAQGRTQEAMRVNNEALASTLEQRAVPAVGALEKAWSAVGRAVSGAWDALKGIGRESTDLDKLTELNKRMADLVRNRAAAYSPDVIRNNERLQAELQVEIDAVAERLRLQQRSQNQQAEAARQSAKDIQDASAEHQGVLAQISEAGSQKRLAQTLAGLSAEQSAVERTYAAGLSSELARDQALGAIEQRRLQAQRQAVQEQIAIERQRASAASKPDEVRASQATVTGLEARLVDINAQIASAAAKDASGRTAATLQRSRENAQAWADIWQRAAEQVRQLVQQNNLAQAERETNPQERAAKTAEAAVAQTQRDLAELKRDLALQISLTVDPAQKAALQTQLDTVGTEGAARLDEIIRTALLDSFSQQFGEVADELDRRLRIIDRQEQRGAITTEQAEARKNAARADSKLMLDELIQAQRDLAQTPAEVGAVNASAAQVDEITAATNAAADAMNTVGKSALTNFLGNVTTGATSAKAAVRGLFTDILKGALAIINQRIGESLADSLFPKAGAAGGAGSFLSTAGSFMANLLQFHQGSIAPQTRQMPALAAMQAIATGPRFHTGLRSNELLAVLEDDETVLTGKQSKRVASALSSRTNLGGNQVAVNVSVQGASGNATDQQAAGNELGANLSRVVQDEIATWAAKQSRAGGVLARR